MQRILSHSLTAGLIAVGACAWLHQARPVVSDEALKAPLNPLGICGSPYGEVFAMAMQEPIDTYFHGAMEEGDDHEHAAAATKKAASGNRLDQLLASMETAMETRTNPKAAGEAQKRYLRRQVEDKLRFGYQLDPSHYANYNSLHFFLTEPELGTRPELTPSAAKLAEDTIAYCLKQDNDPRPALTAASAASNILELMFNDRLNKDQEPKFTTAQMRQYLGVLDHCIARYVDLAQQWDKTKNWELISTARIAECDERFQFICHFRETAEGTILRFEGRPQPAQVAN